MIIDFWTGKEIKDDGSCNNCKYNCGYKEKILVLYGVISTLHIHTKIMDVVIINLDVKEVQKNEMY